MRTNRRTAGAVAIATGATGALLLSSLGTATASSHREAPLITEDPVADSTDVYAFMAPGNSDNLVLVSNWIPLEEPSGGPNYFQFGDDVLYTINIDNDGDAVEDIVYEWVFRTEYPNTGSDLNTLANYAINNGPVSVEGDGYSDTLRVKQTYTLTRYDVDSNRRTTLGSDLPVPPNNIGPRSTPDYDSLVEPALVDLGGGAKTFAGQRDEVFPVDLGAVFDLGGIRQAPFNQAHLIPLENEPSVDSTTGYNVHSLVLEVPKSEVVDGDDAIGIWSDTFRRKNRVFAGNSGASLEHSGPWVQVSRLGNPLVNELVVPLSLKDVFNASDPSGDAQFAPAVVQPTIDDTLLFLYGDSGAFECYPDSGVDAAGPGTDDEERADLVAVFLTGLDGAALGAPWDTRVGDATPSEMLRIDTSVAQSQFPNGRALEDDVVDTALQAVVGAFGACNGAGGDAPIGSNEMDTTQLNRTIGDGLVVNGAPGEPDLLDVFPYMPAPHQGYESQVPEGRNTNANPSS